MPEGASTSREREIARALGLVEARCGPGVVRRLRAASPREAAVVPTGVTSLDLATGIGGLPRGAVIELVGVESSGKTAILYAALAAAQADDGLVALIDAEGTADGETLLACGVDLDALIIAYPASAPDAFLLLTILARCRALDLLALVSIPALRDLPPGTAIPARDASGDRPLDLAAPDLARLVARGLRVLAPALRDSPTAVVVVNEPVFAAASPHAPHGTSGRSRGGLALGHHVALRILAEQVARLADSTGGTRGLRVALTIAKSKVGAPGGRATVEVLVGRGVARAADLLACGLANGVITATPHGLVAGAHPLGATRAAAERTLDRDHALATAVRAAVLATLRPADAA